MRFIFPAAFSLLLALPLLLLPYLLRQRHPRRTVPALFLYRDIASPARRRLWGRLQLSPLFLLQLLILLLLVVIAARPVLHYDTVGKIALVLDTSASMQARAPSGRGSVFEAAKDAIRQELAVMPAESRLSLFTTNPLGAAESGADIRAVVDRIRVSDAPDPSEAVLSAFLTRLRRDHGFERVLFVTDRPVTDQPETHPAALRHPSQEGNGNSSPPRRGGPEGRGGFLRTVTLDSSRPNIGLSTFRLYRSPFFPDEVHATVGIHAPEDALSQLPGGQVVIEDGQTRQRLAGLPLPPSISPDRGEEKGGQAQSFSFSRLPLAPSYRARILFGEGEEGDGLAVDNEAYATLPPLEEIAVLLVSPTPEVGDSLEQIPNLTLTLMTPQDYDPSAVTSASEFTCILFHLTAPETLPPLPAAFFLPPDDNPLFSLGQSARQPALTHWTHGHPLTSYVTFPLLTPAYAQALQPSGWNTPIIESTVGPLLLAGERAGRRYVVTGFDLLPYLGRRNLPASILTLNIVGWLSDRASQSSPYQTGAVLSRQSHTDSPTAPARSVRFPRETDFQPAERALSLDRQGVYTFRENGVERLVAVNLLSPEETDLGRPFALNPPVSPLIRGERSRVSPLSEGNIRGVPVWLWLLLAVLVLCSLEWWWVARKEKARE